MSEALANGTITTANEYLAILIDAYLQGMVD
jgi:hypothetical protein